MLLEVLSRLKAAGCRMLQSSRMPRQHTMRCRCQEAKDLQPWHQTFMGPGQLKATVPLQVLSRLMPTSMQLLLLLH